MSWEEPDDDETYEEDEDENDSDDDLLLCPSCGQFVHEDTQKCPHCGEWIVPVHPESKWKKYIWIVAVVFLVFAFLLMAFN